MTEGPQAAPGLERLAAVQQDLLQALERTQQEGREAASATQAFARVSGRASSPDNAITVVVDSNGVPSEVAFTEKIAKRTPQQLAAEFMGCMKRAQATLAEEFAQQAGNNPFAARIARGYQDRFPQPAPDPALAWVNSWRDFSRNAFDSLHSSEAFVDGTAVGGRAVCRDLEIVADHHAR